jgi:N-terminal domain of Peptidase_S41 in eukaryotic IRBP
LAESGHDPEKGEKGAAVETVGDLLTVNYVFPDRAAQAKVKITGALAAGDYDEITDASMFAQLLTADLQALGGCTRLAGFPGSGVRHSTGKRLTCRILASFVRRPLIEDIRGSMLTADIDSHFAVLTPMNVPRP